MEVTRRQEIRVLSCRMVLKLPPVVEINFKGRGLRELMVPKFGQHLTDTREGTQEGVLMRG